MAALQKQLSSQKKQFEEEAKVREQLQEEHDKELRHLKRDIKHKQVGWKKSLTSFLVVLWFHTCAKALKISAESATLWGRLRQGGGGGGTGGGSRI